MNQITDTASFALLAGEAGFDPIEERLRANVRATIEAVFEEDIASFLGRCATVGAMAPRKRYCHGHRERQLTGTFGTETVGAVLHLPVRHRRSGLAPWCVYWKKANRSWSA
jgi:putative transposase